MSNFPFALDLPASAEAGPSTNTRKRTADAQERSAKRRKDHVDPDIYQAKIRKQLDQIPDIIQSYASLQIRVKDIISTVPHDILVELRGPHSAHPPPNRSDLLFALLDQVATAQKLFPVPPSIRPNFSAWTVDYLLRLICDFWKTGGEHPALRRVEDEAETESEEKDRRFRLYVRICKVEVEELKTKYLDQLEKTRPLNTPAIQAMKSSLPETPGLVYDKYLGQTLKSAEGRQEQDQQRASRQKKVVGTRWLHRLGLNKDGPPFTVYEFIDPGTFCPETEQLWRLEANGADQWTHHQAWYGNPGYGILEYLLILSSCGRSWNSAVGGPTNLAVTIDPAIRQMIKKVNERAPTTTTLSYTDAVTDIDADTLMPNAIPDVEIVGGSDQVTPFLEQAPKAEPDKVDAAWLQGHFKNFRRAFEEADAQAGRKSRSINDAALLQASQSAERRQVALENRCSGLSLRYNNNSLSKSRDDDEGLLIFAKDVTIWDSLSLGHWWSPTTGPGPKLLRFLNETVKFAQPCPFAFHVEDMPVDRPPIIDYWALSLHHIETTLANIFCSIYLEKQRPRVILCLSAKVHQILSEGRLVLPVDPMGSDVNVLMTQTAISTLKACRRISKTNKKQGTSLSNTEDLDVIPKNENKENDADEVIEDSKDVKLIGSPIVTTGVDELEDEDERQLTQAQKVEDQGTDDTEVKDIKIKPEEDEDEDGSDQETNFDDGKLKHPRKMKASSSNLISLSIDDSLRGSTPGGPESSSDDDDDDDDDDDHDDFPEWSELQEAGFTELMGTLHAVEYGKSRWAISVPMLHPGFYKYAPVLQQALFPLMILVRLLASLAARESGEGFINEETVLAKINQIQSISTDLGLTDAINSARDKALRQIKAINSLAVLTHAGDDITTALTRFDRLSKHNQRVRSDVLASQVLAQGLPGSPERKAQIGTLVQDPSFRLNNHDCPKGSPPFWAIMMDLPVGRAYHLAWQRARYSSEAQIQHLEKARLVAVASTRTNAATKGPFPGWNAKKSPQQVLDILLDVTQVHPDRLKATKKAMRILRCSKELCQYPLGIETEHLRQPYHWCNLEQPPFRFPQYLPEWMEGEILCFPYQLIEKGFLKDVNVDGQLIKDMHGSPSWVDESKGTAAQQAVYRKIQHEYHNMFFDMDTEGIDINPHLVALYKNLIERL